ncbi:ADP-dependent NAD(P)H-hydrate dehydratase [Microbacterium sp.]|uniref:ADP-dependent NAD(P)H-hydrate dehydratase n=1 Tax=Microbacterium sp. TaxID=51671 RepID=UPI003F729D42
MDDDRRADVREIARRDHAVVACCGTIAIPSGECWEVPVGGAGLGTSGSGDVRAGVIAGLAARGIPGERAAVWGSWVHGEAGDRLTERVGIGFLARDIARELTAALTSVERPSVRCRRLGRGAGR